MLSVLIPSRNSEATIQQALFSVLKNINQDDEVIVLDDASTDSSISKVQSIKDQRIRLETSSIQNGVGQSLNLLLGLAKGSFVARMDSDDLTLSGRFKHQHNIFERMKSDLLFGNTIRDYGLVKLPELPIGFSSEEISKLLPFFNPVSHGTLFCRKDVLREIGPYSLGRGQDYELWLRAALDNRVLLKDARLVVSYKVPKTNSSELDQERARRIAELRQRLFVLKSAHYADETIRMSENLEDDNLDELWARIRRKNFGALWPLMRDRL